MSKFLADLVRSISVADPQLLSSAARGADHLLAPATLLKKTDDLLPYAGRNMAKDLGFGPHAQNAAYIGGNMVRRLPAAAALTYGGAELGAMAQRYGGGTKSGLFNLISDTITEDGPTQAIAEASPEDKWWASLSQDEKMAFRVAAKSRQQRPEVIAARPRPAVMPIEAVDAPRIRPISHRELQRNMVTGYPGEDEIASN